MISNKQYGTNLIGLKATGNKSATKVNNIMKYLVACFALLQNTSSQAEELTIPHVFSAGEAAVAAEVNANFNATKIAVNTKQDKLTGSNCTQNEVVQSIEENGFVNCVEAMPSRTAYLSFSGEAFVSSTSSPVVTGSDIGGAYITTVNSTGTLVTAVHLPDGAVITEFAIWAEDAAPGTIEASLNRRTLGSNGRTEVSALSTTGVYSSGIRNYLSSPLNETVDNATYAYAIRIHADTWPGNTALRIQAARITYVY